MENDLNIIIKDGNTTQHIDANELIADYKELSELEHLYNSAIKQLTIKFEILNDEFKVKYERSPIHHIESRLKSQTSIVKKLLKRGKDLSLESARENINDIAGVRVVCCYIDDVYAVADMLLRQSDIKLIKEQDYIKHPNYNGYRSLHLDIQIPIYLSEKTELVRVEVQLRTVAMDFWASLEHKMRYKKNIAPDQIKFLQDELSDCAKQSAALDERMQNIRNVIIQNSPEEEDEEGIFLPMGLPITRENRRKQL